MLKSGISSFRAILPFLGVVLFYTAAVAQLLLGAGDGRKPAGGGGGNDCSGTGTIAVDTNACADGGCSSWNWSAGVGTDTRTTNTMTVAGSNRVALIGIITFEGETVASVTGSDTGAFTKVTAQTGNSGEGFAQNIEVWRRTAPPTGSYSATVVFNTNPAFAAAILSSYTSVNQSAPLFSFNSGNNNATTNSYSLGTSATGGNNCWVAGYTFNRLASISAGAGTTLRQTQGDSISLWDSGTTVTAGTPALAWTGTSFSMPGAIVVALAPTP